MRIAARALIAAVSLLVIVASGVAWAEYKSFSASVPHGAAVPALTAGERDPDGAAQNILLVGDDTRAGATPAELSALHTGHDTTTANADTMMLLHLPVHGRPTIISFPRDSWVDVPGYGRNKMNAAYPDGYNAAKARHATEVQAQSAGLLETIKTIHALTGLHVDHYAQVNLLGFYRISEAVGGVTVCLNHAQNKTTETDDSGGRGFSGIDLPAGVSVIKGKQALAFVRQRHGLPHGDLDRIKRQQYFLKATFAKVSSAGTLLNPFKVKRLLEAVSPSLLTDPQLDLLDLARQFQTLSSGSIRVETIPNKGPQLIYPDGVETSIVAVDTAAMPAFVTSLEQRPPTGDPLASVRAAAPGTVTVDVRNGTDTAGLAARNAAALTALRFRTGTVDSADSTATTTAVQYPPGQQAQAKAVLAAVPGARGVATAGLSHVRLLLGTDGKLVRGLAAPSTPRSSAPGATDRTHGLGCID